MVLTTRDVCVDKICRIQEQMVGVTRTLCTHESCMIVVVLYLYVLQKLAFEVQLNTFSLFFFFERENAPGYQPKTCVCVDHLTDLGSSSSSADPFYYYLSSLGTMISYNFGNLLVKLSKLNLTIGN